MAVSEGMNDGVSGAPVRRLSVIAAVVSLLSSVSCAGAADAGDIELPPAAAPFDYQIGEPYEPPNGVRIVARDHRTQPVEGVYNVCYVNAFQAQPGAQGEW